MPTTPKMTYMLAARAGYKFDIVKMGFNVYDQLSYLYKADFPDMEIKRPNQSGLQELHEKYLITVNGYVYNTVYSQGRLYAPKAAEGMLRSRSNAVGIVSLEDISTNITKHAITPAMVTTDLNILSYDKVFITFATPIAQPVLVMAGYIIPYNEQYFYRVSDNAFALCLSKLQYHEKLYELLRYRDIFKDLGVEVSPTNPTMVDVQELRSDTVIKRFLSLDNSFVVDLGVPSVALRKIYLEHSNVPGNFRTEIAPNMPMIVGYGKLCEYAVVDVGLNKYTVSTQDYHYNNYLFSGTAQRDLEVSNTHRKPGSTYHLTHAFFLEMTTS